MMIVLTIIRLSKGNHEGHPPIAKFTSIPNLFGICVYSFMCHHSLPQMVTPIRNKSNIIPLFAGNYGIILTFYCLLSFLGIFSFSTVDDLYTLNFQPPKCARVHDEQITNSAFIQYFLALFPVFTLSTSFPIIAITLRNNMKVLVRGENPLHWAIERLLFPTVTLLVPIAIALATSNIQFLVGITGSYAGAAIQYIVPACLVLLARRQTSAVVSDSFKNKLSSPFQHRFWIAGVILWSIVCIVLVTVNNIFELISKK